MDRKQRRVTVWCQDPHREMAAADQMQRISWITTVKDDLVPAEAASPRDPEQGPHLFGRQARQQSKLHTTSIRSSRRENVPPNR